MDNQDELFIYEGPSALRPEHFPVVPRSEKVLMVELEAVFPSLAAPPLLDRLEYETVRNAQGWEKVGRSYALRGWRRRVGELAAGFNAAWVFSYREHADSAGLLTTQLQACIPRAQADWWPLKDWGYSSESDCYIDAFTDCLASMERRGVEIDALEIYLNRDEHFVREVQGGLVGRRDQLQLKLHTVNARLGLLPVRIPMPEGFEDLDDWLDLNAPLPGTVRPEKSS